MEKVTYYSILEVSQTARYSSERERKLCEYPGQNKSESYVAKCHYGRLAVRDLNAKRCKKKKCLNEKQTQEKKRK